MTGSRQIITDQGPEQEMSLGEKIQRAWDQFCSWVWQVPGKADSFGVRFLRGALRILFIVFRESRNDRITLRASALTFTVVLSLVPMLALGTAVLKGLGAGDQMREAAYTLIDQFDTGEPGGAVQPEPGRERAIPGDERLPESVQPHADASAIETMQENQAEEEPAGLTSHLRRAVDQIFDYVDRTDFTTLGTFGILGMVFAALGVLGSIERSMNAIWQTTTGRAFGRKVIDYMALMILLPISVNLALAVQGGQLTQGQAAVCAARFFFDDLHGFDQLLAAVTDIDAP